MIGLFVVERRSNVAPASELGDRVGIVDQGVPGVLEDDQPGWVRNCDRGSVDFLVGNDLGQDFRDQALAWRVVVIRPGARLPDPDPEIGVVLELESGIHHPGVNYNHFSLLI
jgi:hypothetical protein